MSAFIPVAFSKTCFNQKLSLNYSITCFLPKRSKASCTGQMFAGNYNSDFKKVFN